MCNPNMPMQNRRKKQGNKKKSIRQDGPQAHITSKDAEVILPPGGGTIVPYNQDKTFRTYESAASQLPCLPSQPAIPQRMAAIHGMSGQCRFISTRKLRSPDAPLLSVTTYLQRFLDMYVCLDLWHGNSGKKEQCGILTEVGQNFIVIEDTASQMLSVIDLKPIQYINIYCP